jgi:redox-sensitive bicupin YhaK (pirin superfamily)
MIERREFSGLGGADHGWLKAKHHFSFARYYDPSRMGWGSLRVWNDDEIAAGAGFPPHPHADMEIITYIREGAITHQDSMGNKGRTEAGDVQVMSAGSGVRHSEYNLEDETTRLFQIWIEPAESGGKPSWGAKRFPKGDRSGRFVTLASGFDGDATGDATGDNGALRIRADARVMGATIKAGERVTLTLDPVGHAYLVPATGALDVGGVRIEARDGAAITGESTVEVVGVEDAEVVLVQAA